jgi:pantoate--beta-alanine ligase
VAADDTAAGPGDGTRSCAGISEGEAVDYLALCDASDLQRLTTLDRPARLLAAVHLGTVRLIDNIAVLPV